MKRNRAQIEPYGTDFGDVLKRAKRAYRLPGEFIIWRYEAVWNTATTPAPGLEAPTGAITYRFSGGRWSQV